MTEGEPEECHADEGGRRRKDRDVCGTAMRVADYDTQGKRSSFRLPEKGGKYLVIPAHHMAQAWTDEYIDRAGLAADPKGPLFPSAGRRRGSDRLTRRAMDRTDALKMMKRRAQRAGLPAEVCAHSFRGTGIIWILHEEYPLACRVAATQEGKPVRERTRAGV